MLQHLLSFVPSIVTQSKMMLKPMVRARFLQTSSMPRKSTFRNCCSHQWFLLCFDLFHYKYGFAYIRNLCYFQGESSISANINNAMNIASAKLLLSLMVLTMFRNCQQYLIYLFTISGRDAGTLEFVTFGAFLFSPF